MIFTGDTIFRGVWGRTDLPTGSINEIMSSITNKILILPDDTMIYPGHGLPTTVKEEKNIYLKLEPRGF
jgi:glyoxylase-like metal-dependent hydrolase (beta-lactamase superfamily II)